MDFNNRLEKIKVLQDIIDDHMRDNKIKYEEDITNRVIRDYMFAVGLLKSSVAGCYEDDTQDYYADQAGKILNEY